MSRIPSPVRVAVALACAAAPLAAADPLDKPPLAQADFTYLGSFRMPTVANGWSTAFASGGFTLRRVGGELRFLTTSHTYNGGLVYEVSYPGIAAAEPFPSASGVREWGDVYDGHKWVGNDGGGAGLGGGVATNGLFWDEASRRLYWTYGHWYNTTHPFNPSVGYATLDDASGDATGVGAWSLVDRPEKFSRGGMLRIPAWFASRFTGGRRLAVGFGGYYSIISSGSLGPSLAAITPPDPGAHPDRSALPNVPLVGFPSGAPDRGHRDTDYRSEYDGGNWNPSGGTGYWTWSDTVGGATWIDLPERGGVLVLAKVGRGRVWYETSDLHAERGAYQWFVFRPKDLAAVASGTKPQWEAQPSSFWGDPTLPLAPLDGSGWSGTGIGAIGGVAFDHQTNRLYVLASSVWKSGVEWHPQVYVYQVAGSLGDPEADGGTGGATTATSGGPGTTGGAGGADGGSPRCGTGGGWLALVGLLALAWHGRPRGPRRP